MSLYVGSANFKSAFCSNMNIISAKKFAKKQIGHAIYQGTILGLSETLNPSFDLHCFVARKVLTDVIEAIGTKIGHKTPLTAERQCTNMFAYMADGFRAIAKSVKGK